MKSPWHSTGRVKRKCQGCVRAQDCRGDYFKRDGTCPYRVEQADYKEWLEEKTYNPFGNRIMKEGS